MILKSIEISGLLGRNATLKADFNADLNVVTGRNGAGKTTFLKLCWYLTSGSIHRALSEIEFDTVALETDKFKLKLVKVASHTCSGSYEDDKQSLDIKDEIDEESENHIDARDTFSELI